MVERCVPFEAAEFRFKPLRPKTPRLSEVSCPAAFNPPVAPLETPFKEPAAFAVELTVEFNAPPAAPPTLAAVFVTPPTAPPAVDATPPRAPRPPAIPEPAADAPAPAKVSRSGPAALL